MKEFHLSRRDKSIGPDFDKAAQILTDNSDVIVETMKINKEEFIINVSTHAVDEVKASLPGWTFKSPNF